MEKSVYRVSFFKTLQEGAGHPHDCCQGEVEVHASGDPEAVVIARRRFAETSRTSGTGRYAARTTRRLSVSPDGSGRRVFSSGRASKASLTRQPALSRVMTSERAPRLCRNPPAQERFAVETQRRTVPGAGFVANFCDAPLRSKIGGIGFDGTAGDDRVQRQPFWAGGDPVGCALICGLPDQLPPGFCQRSRH